MFIHDAMGQYLIFLVLALLVALLTQRFSHLPYTITLVIVGLVVGLLKLAPSPETVGFSHDLVLFVLLPPLLFFGALHLELNRLLSHFWPILIFAIVGVAVSTLVIAGIIHWVGGLGSMLAALIFGSMLSPTDPVSVLAVFKEAGVSKDLRHVVEGESLFNDGTSIVLFVILVGIFQGTAEATAASSVVTFLKVSGGGMLLGLGLGYLTWLFIRSIDDPLLETTACLTLAMGSFWVAEIFHLSGVIATVCAGVLIGNHGRHLSMSPKVTQVVFSFFEVLEFLVNSVLFLMIGLEMQVISFAEWGKYLPLVGAGVLGMLVARAVVVYPSWHLLNLAGRRRPRKWSHVLFWGGLRGSIPIALLLGLPRTGPLAEYWKPLLVAGFGVVLFSLVVQGLTVKPLLHFLKIEMEPDEEDEGGGEIDHA